VTGSSASESPAFSFRSIVREFTSREGQRILAVGGVSFEASREEITCIVGPTGSGKSTILRIASGLDLPDAGEALVEGGNPRGTTGKIGFLTQHHTLFPWLRVADNIGIPLDVKKTDSATRRRKVEAICSMLGLDSAVALYPHELSGGMKQRAALGRLMATEAPYWLLDEPFSSLDDRTVHQLQRLLLRLVRENRISALFVTHSIDEAVFLARRVVVLSAQPGRVVETLDIDMPYPRDRLSAAYGETMERIRRQIESALEAEP
jgi:NitT/TauT family transport system ATP-binding protein